MTASTRSSIVLTDMRAVDSQVHYKEKERKKENKEKNGKSKE